MKNIVFYLAISLLLAGMIVIQGCGSADFQGAKVQEERNKNYEEAEKLYEKELKKNPINQEAWFRLGRIRGVHLNDFSGMNEAFSETDKISDKFSNDIKIIRKQLWLERMRKGVDYKDRANADSMEYYEKAIEEYKTASIIWPDTSLSYHYLTIIYQDLGDIENVFLCEKKAWNLDHDGDQYKQVGRYLVQQGLVKKQQFKEENSDKLKLQDKLKEIDKGSYKSDVLKALNAPDSKRKDKKNPKRENWTYDQYGITLTLEGERVVGKKVDKKIDMNIDSTKYKEAMIIFNKAVEVFEDVKAASPKDNENLNLLLQAYYGANRIKEATTSFKLAVENDPGNKNNHFVLGLLYKIEGSYEESIGEFTEALKIDPNFSDVFYEIGAAYVNWGVKLRDVAQEKGDENTEYKAKFKEALPWMEKAVGITKDDVKIWDTLGKLYTLMGQAGKAMKAYDEADKLRRAGK